MVVGKSSCAGSRRRDQRNRISPVRSCCAAVCLRWRSANGPFLVIATIVLILNCDGFSLGEKRQKNINVDVVISQMTDIDACGANLRSIVPKNVAIARIARRSSSVGPVKKQAG
jgi:hypothetical protein